MRIVSRTIPIKSIAEGVRISFLGDWHLGVANCDKKYIKGAIKTIISEPSHYVIGMGDYIDAIEDLVYNVGVDHVGIGTDFTQDQSNKWMDELFYQQGTKPKKRAKPYPNPVHHPRGLENPSKLSSVATELSDRGYSAQDIGKIMGGNWMKLLKATWTG